MSGEAVDIDRPAAASKDEETKEQNANVKDTANGESTKEPKKFSVNKVKFGPELADLPEDTDSNELSSPASPNRQPKSPLAPEHFTFGYATNEAIPMTIFYRSQHSQGHGGKQRPTLQELRKGLENDKVGKHSSFLHSYWRFSFFFNEYRFVCFSFSTQICIFFSRATKQFSIHLCSLSTGNRYYTILLKFALIS